MIKKIFFMILLACSSLVYGFGESGDGYVYVENNTGNNTAIGLGDASISTLMKLTDIGVKTGSDAGNVDIEVKDKSKVFIKNSTGDNIAIGGSRAGNVTVKIK